jgi:hypothetical protein
MAAWVELWHGGGHEVILFGSITPCQEFSRLDAGHQGSSHIPSANQPNDIHLQGLSLLR